MAKKKKSVKIPNGLLPLLPNKEKVNKLISNWRLALPVNLGNFFSYGSNDEVARYDTYKLDSRFIPFIIHNLDGLNENINRIIIELGRSGSDKTPELNDQVFEPILKIELAYPVGRRKEYYFLFNRIEKPFVLLNPPGNKLSADSNVLEQISPKIAELFILNWQSLSDVNLANAFEGLSADKILIEEKNGKTNELLFGSQKHQRVRKYLYTSKESRAIINNLKNNKVSSFFLNLGSGLEVPNLHPFSFRPIIRIDEEVVDANEIAGGGNSNYYDTSRPCPPLCPPDN